MTNNVHPWQQRLGESEDIDDPLDTYLDRINRVVYGDKTRRKTLHALLRLIFNTGAGHLTKGTISEEAGVSLKNLYNKSVFTVFSDFGLVYLVEKVHRDKGVYIIPDQTVCRPLYETEPYGLMRTDINDYPEASRLMHWFGIRLAQGDGVPIRSGDLSRPIEWQMEFTAIELGVEQPVDVNMGVVGARTEGQSDSWQFILKGELDGNVAYAHKEEVRDWLKRKMTSITKASLTNHRVCCPCSTLENHLIAVEQGEERFLPDDQHFVEFSEDGSVQFVTVLNKLKTDSGGD